MAPWIARPVANVRAVGSLPNAIIAVMHFNVAYRVVSSSSLLQTNAPMNWRPDNVCQTSREKKKQSSKCGHVNFKVEEPDKCEIMRLRFMEIKTVAAAVQLFVFKKSMFNALRHLCAVRLEVGTKPDCPFSHREKCSCVSPPATK